MKKSKEQKLLEKQSKTMFLFAEKVYNYSVYQVGLAIDEHCVNLRYSLESSLCDVRLAIEKVNQEKNIETYTDLTVGRCSGWLAKLEGSCRVQKENLDWLLSTKEHMSRLKDRNSFIREVIQELETLKEKDDTFRIKKGQLFIKTDDIILKHDGIEYDFGPFEIQFRITQGLSPIPTYIYVFTEALEPNPAKGHEDHVHPHVSGGEPCLGQAGPIMINSLMNGSVLTALDAIKSMLNTYNPKSPFTKLEDWDRYCECHECGENVRNEDDERYCEHCDESYCPDCWYICSVCDEGSCGGNCPTCKHCEESVCRDCREYCERCDSTICKECYGVCESCQGGCCQGCLEECDDCNERFCERCLEDGCCANCQENKIVCSHCKSDIDEDDVRDLECDECGKNLGEGCIDCQTEEFVCHDCL